jgi:hypothetical protein
MNLRKGTKPRINIIKDENGNLVADPQSVLNRWKNFFNQVPNLHGVHDIRQMDIHTVEPLVPEPSLVEVEIAIGKLKSYKSPGTDQIPAELIKAGGGALYSEIHNLVKLDLLLSRRLSMMKFSRAISRVKWLSGEKKLTFRRPP